MDDTHTTRTRPRRPLSRSLCPPHTTSRARAPRDRAPSRRRRAAARRSSRPRSQQQPPNPATAARAPTRNTFRESKVPRGTHWARDDTHARAGQRDADHTRARRCTKPCAAARGQHVDRRSSCAAGHERLVGRERRSVRQNDRGAAGPVWQRSGQHALSRGRGRLSWATCQKF